MAAILAGTLAGQLPPQAAQAATTPKLTTQRYPSVSGNSARATRPGPDRTVTAAKVKRRAPRWPAAGAAEVTLPAVADGARVAAAPAVRAGTLPVTVRQVSGAAGARPAATGPTRVRVEVMSKAAAQTAGVNGLLVRVGRTDGAASAGQVEVGVDYAAFASAYGADWSSRLRLFRLPECALTTPAATACQPIPLDSRNDVRSRTLSAPVPTTPIRSAVPAADGERLGLSSTAALTGTLVAATSGPSGGAGDFTASSLAPASTWGHSGSTGGFQWSYPMTTPPAVGGPAPDLKLSYSAQSVDGLNAATNNQPGPIGEGFDLSPGFVERRYKACADDMGGDANNTTKTGDLCWGAENAVLSLGGSTVELIKGGDGRWHPRKEDGSKIELLTTPAYGNGDNDNEYWKVTTADGTQYWFGRHQLPGWSSGRPTTNSVLTVPVYGNNPGEPCYASTFAASECAGKRQAWRWNLDYVQDVHGNTMSLWWTKETNYYAKNRNSAAPVAYDRGAYLTRIDYGTDNRDNNEYAATSPYVENAPARVEFTNSDRCLANCTTKNATTWPDTPWDQECTATTNPCVNGSPTFWSAKRLTLVKTRVWKGSAYQDVNSWTLRHTFPDPGDGTRAGLWLAGVTRRGLNGTTVTVPEVTFAGIQMQNRVDAAGSDWALAMNWWRVNSIRTETGGEIFVTYSPRQCVKGGTMPTNLDDNSLRCFPVRWTPPGYTAPITDYFHKYVVTEVQQIDHTGGARPLITAYEYQNPNGLPLWRYSDDNGLIPTSRKSWSEWRGYPKVITRVGEGADQTKTETLYFRGMDGDKLAAGGTRSVTVQGLEGGAATDQDAFAGMPREQITWQGSTIVSASVSDPWQSGPTASRSGTPAVDARFVAVGTVRTRTALDGGAWRRTKTVTTYDAYGMPVSLEDQGDEAVSTDTRCSTTEYIRNTTGANWLLKSLKRTQGWAGPCATPPTSEAQVTGDTRYSYDNLAYGTAPTKGIVTAIEEVKDFNGGSRLYQQVATMKYDAQGRATETTDITGKATKTAYTPAAGGPLTSTVVTNPLLWTETTELDPATGATTKKTDANNRVTEVAYDALGRTTTVWQPDRSRAIFPNNPSVRYTYTYSTTGVSSVKSEQLDARGGYRVGYKLVDALGRDRQTQELSYGGGRIITDTFYDAAGRVYKANAPYYNSAAAGTTLFLGLDLDVPNQTRILFDAAGRPIHSIQFSRNVEKWRTSTTYHGDHVDTTPPVGGTATTTWTDPQGQTTKLWQYHGPTPSGSYDETRYAYEATGLLKSVTDASGNSWSYQYDIRGRNTITDDPDKGRTTTVYNSLDQVESVTDSRGKTLWSSYDDLGRLTATRDTSGTGPLVASFVYDLPAKGVLRSSSRWVGTDEYKTETISVDARYRQTQVRYTIPAVEGALAGTYSVKQTFNADGSPNTLTLPDAGGMAAEILTYGYDSTYALPDKLATDYGDATHYVIQTSYSNLNQPNLVTRAKALTGAPFVQSGQYYDETTGRVSRRPVIRSVAPSYIANATFGYDAAGNITSIDDDPGSGRDTQCFSYDHLRRLTEAWTPASYDCSPAPSSAGLGGPAKYWTSWSFGTPTDAKGRVGNRLSQVEHATATGDVTTTYGYHAAGATQPHAVWSTSRTDNAGTVTGTYDYDSAGNLTSRPGPNGQQSLTWTVDGELASVSDSAGTSSYVTDPAGGRLVSRDPKGTTLHLGATEVRLDKASNGVTATRYYEFLGEIVAQRSTTGGITWLAADYQGTGQVAVSGDATQAVTRRRQTPFGTERGGPASWPNARGFVDGYRDSTGLTQVGQRAYDPGLGRFVSVDPVLDHYDPQQMNAYIYGDNSPVTFSDPSGQRWEEETQKEGLDKIAQDTKRRQAEYKKDQGDTLAHATAVILRTANLKKNYPHAHISSDASGRYRGGDIICWDCKAGEVWVWEVKPHTKEAQAEADLARHIETAKRDIRAKGKRVIAGPNSAFNPPEDESPTLGEPRARTRVFNGKKDGVQLYEQKRTKERAPRSEAKGLREAEEIASDANEDSQDWKMTLFDDHVEGGSFVGDVVLFTPFAFAGVLAVRWGIAAVPVIVKFVKGGPKGCRADYALAC
ncbi:RHS repeat-associated core domain-containing protein [Micromonospora auratinigra]|uniref:RHS repeat-associated core domain-containing protein n=1 Tax=Micromonospora auratinigra TaxID=261654 RepID=A0A1A8ZWK9_9ACTN|nr:RHS repeat-associated core domain-containing protein [Micromonospora auratinigra]SBT48270.1 RHS repeat-associated core domain-containing protein [Micromonospora auratinigra]